MGKGGRGYNGRVFNADMVVEFVFFFQAPEYCDCLLNAWFADIYGLETSFKGGDLFLCIYGIHRGLWRRYSGVLPVARAGFSIFDASTEPWAPPAPTIVWSSSMKEDNSACSFIDFFQDRFQPVFKFSSKFGCQREAPPDRGKEPACFSGFPGYRR